MECEEYDRVEAARLEEKRYQVQIRREERQREEDRRREENLRRVQESKNREDALRQCGSCINSNGCRNYGKYPNCPNYRHR